MTSSTSRTATTTSTDAQRRPRRRSTRSADGEYFQMPWKSNPVMIFYNKDLFAAGRPRPREPAAGHLRRVPRRRRARSSTSGVAQYAIYPAPTSEFFQSWFDFYPLYAAETGGTQLRRGRQGHVRRRGRARRSPSFWRRCTTRGSPARRQYQGDSFADGRPRWRSSDRGPSPSTATTSNWGSVPVPTSDGTPRRGDLHLQRREEHRPVHAPARTRRPRGTC